MQRSVIKPRNPYLCIKMNSQILRVLKRFKCRAWPGSASFKTKLVISESQARFRCQVPQLEKFNSNRLSGSLIHFNVVKDKWRFCYLETLLTKAATLCAWAKLKSYPSALLRVVRDGKEKQCQKFFYFSSLKKSVKGIRQLWVHRSVKSTLQYFFSLFDLLFLYTFVFSPFCIQIPRLAFVPCFSQET